MLVNLITIQDYFHCFYGEEFYLRSSGPQTFVTDLTTPHLWYLFQAG